MKIYVCLLLKAKDKIYAQAWTPVTYDLWQWHLIVWLAPSEDGAWSHTQLVESIRAHYEWLVQYKGSNEKQSKETKFEKQ